MPSIFGTGIKGCVEFFLFVFFVRTKGKRKRRVQYLVLLKTVVWSLLQVNPGAVHSLCESYLLTLF